MDGWKVSLFKFTRALKFDCGLDGSDMAQIRPHVEHWHKEAMSDVSWRLLSMQPGMRDVICWRYAGWSYRETGSMLGMSMAAAESCHRRALTAWPALCVLFSEKVTKQVRRKPHSPVGGAETDGFEDESGYSTGVSRGCGGFCANREMVVTT